MILFFYWYYQILTACFELLKLLIYTKLNLHHTVNVINITSLILEIPTLNSLGIVLEVTIYKKEFVVKLET